MAKSKKVTARKISVRIDADGRTTIVGAKKLKKMKLVEVRPPNRRRKSA
ncbi:MAG: hypothetical protein IT464_11545 [Planctomycetes bacterium]|nr:hypothetical protein [Planctomycetota bacterium]